MMEYDVGNLIVFLQGYIIESLPRFLQGFIVTVEFTIFGSLVGLALGTLLALGDLYGGRAVSSAIRVYVEFFRGSPIIIQLFLFYFTIPGLLSTIFDPFLVGFAVFTLNSGAYQKGYIKGAIEAVSTDQMIAGLSIGLSRAQTIAYVILPQALRLVIPAWSNEFASLTKATPALLAIGVGDLTSVGKSLAGQYYRPLETYSFVAVIYLIWVSIMAKIFDIVYERVRIPGIEISA
jgi:polar amino acid transport system permease protein